MTYSDIKIQQKLTYLRRLLNIRVKLTKFVESVDVEQVKNTIIVQWNINKEDRFFCFERKEFPVADLGKMVEYYKRKIRTEFKNRHKNQ